MLEDKEIIKLLKEINGILKGIIYTIILLIACIIILLLETI